jgi:excinuclease ABC subunit C
MILKQLQKLNLPDNSGIYIFKDSKKRPLYIGRATSLKDRVKSYFKEDLFETRGQRIVDMVIKAKSIDWQETTSVLEAIILESNLIKKYQPVYNIDEKDDKSSMYVVITDEEWPRVYLVRARDFDKNIDTNVKIAEKYGPFPNSGLIKEAMKIIRKIFPYKDKKSLDPRHDNFYKSIGRSPDDNSSHAHDKYMRTIHYLKLFFDGRKNDIRADLQKSMSEYASSMRFEEANECKRLLYALDHINDVSLVKRDKQSVLNEFRIEAYDIAHLSGQNVVGAMVVSVNGNNIPSEYRRFELKEQKNDDVHNLGEIIFRRLNHSEWKFPDLIVVDGNEVQKKRAEDILSVRRMNIPVVAVTKGKAHKGIKIVGDPHISRKFKADIFSINAEAHRFVIAYHRKKRNNSLLLT